MIRLNGNILGLFDIVNRLENGQPMSSTGDPHGLEVIVM
jgi:hypothetical protein